jgi:hypothetical protein
MATSRPVLTGHHILKQHDFVSHLILRFVVLLQDLAPTEYLYVVRKLAVLHLFLHQTLILKLHRLLLLRLQRSFLHQLPKLILRLYVLHGWHFQIKN